ncbi:MAG: protein translocase subunit SecD [Candidatus Tectomicrobia bacterium]|nr:protein translocase subunit SecD [Candidatus Tectomicrobia bacterium]
MPRNLKWKALLIILIVGLAIWRAYPYDRERIHLGLDLQGGIHLLLEAQAGKAVEATADRIVGELRNQAREAGLQGVTVRRLENNDVQVALGSAADSEKVTKFAGEYPEMQLDKQEATTLSYRVRPASRRQIEDNAVQQALETIRNRIDQFGVSEPTVQRQGERRIIVELPGVKDPERAISLIGKTALLEFKLVDDDSSLREALDGKVPLGDEIIYQRVEDKATGAVTKNPYLVKRETLLTGDLLTNAEVNFDTQFNQPYVSITFNKIGGRLFSQITGANVRKRLAIILDNNLYSAPVIQEKIGGGQARITGSFTVDEARDLAIVLRAGSLPAPVTILENRTVGPSLGRDSIERGIRSTIIGGLLVVLFMLVYYRLAGLLANLALVLNLLLLLGAMAQLGATLTLPGIAGIILTVGMAVDANVLIFERIREELREAKTVRAAIDMGYSRAFLTIMDANVTTLIAAVVLFQFGTGPVKGFAVTLSIGIVASMFTAIFVTRTIFDFILWRWRIERLSI